MQHKEQEFAMANEAMLAEFMDRINQIADVVGQNQLMHPDNTDCAGRLRLAVDDLRDVSTGQILQGFAKHWLCQVHHSCCL